MFFYVQLELELHGLVLRRHLEKAARNMVSTVISHPSDKHILLCACQRFFSLGTSTV